jgi:hypothetical protein
VPVGGGNRLPALDFAECVVIFALSGGFSTGMLRLTFKRVTDPGLLWGSRRATLRISPFSGIILSIAWALLATREGRLGNEGGRDVQGLFAVAWGVIGLLAWLKLRALRTSRLEWDTGPSPSSNPSNTSEEG